MRLSAYLNFNGECAAAFRFYERCLGGKLETTMTHGDAPVADTTPQQWLGSRILHARLIVGDTILMGSDSPPDHYEAPRGFSVSLSTESPAEADRVFHALAENGTIRMAIQQTFWAPRFGMLVDQFHIPWTINCE